MNATAQFSLNGASIAARIAQLEREAAEIRDARIRFTATRTSDASRQAHGRGAPATPERSRTRGELTARVRLALSHRRLAPRPSRS